MDTRTTAKVLSRYEAGVLTASEVASKLLYDLVAEHDLDEPFVLSIGLLPDDIKQEFFRLLHAIKQSHYRWVPYLLGVPTEPPDPAKYSEKLRRVYGLLESQTSPQDGAATTLPRAI